MKYISLFSGIGAFEQALKNIGIDFDLLNFSENDKYASKSYCAVHGVHESKNLGDITKIDETKLPKDIDLVTYGFPCQDISLSGKQKGFFDENGNTTRSGLFFDALRIVEATKPKYTIAENVKNLTSKRFKTEFEIVLDALNEAGYNNYWKVLNTKDFGIPQNRERVFIVSIRKDIDDGKFEFPVGFPLELRLKDLLETEVDEKFYLSDKSMDYILSTGSKNFYYKPEIDLDIAKPLTSTMHKMHRAGQDNYVSDSYINNNQKVMILGNVNPSGKGQNGFVIDSEGLARTITLEKGEGQKVLIREATKKGYAEAVEGDSINIEQPHSTTRRGRVGHQIAQTINTTCSQAVVEPFIAASRGRNPDNPSDRTPGYKTIQRLEPNCKGLSNTITTVQKDNYVVEPKELRIRKLTPKECWRLQGFDDESFEKAEKVNSNTQLYKQAGNSITVTVLEYLFKKIFKEVEETENENNEEDLDEYIPYR